jgi:Mg2+ and Co2+ transporter CorA
VHETGATIWPQGQDTEANPGVHIDGAGTSHRSAPGSDPPEQFSSTGSEHGRARVRHGRHRDGGRDPPGSHPLNDGVRARLFDADGHDKVVSLDDGLPKLGDRQLLWIDIDFDAGGSLETVASDLKLRESDIRRIEGDTETARLVRGAEWLHLTLEAVEDKEPSASIDPGPPEDRSARPPELVRRELDLVAIPNIVVSAHHGRVDALERFVDGLEGETFLGALDAAGLLSSFVDEVITGYHAVADRISKEIDRLDQVALRRSDDGLLEHIVEVRLRIGFVRRTLAPHRSALAALGRPEMHDEGSVGEPWPGLPERLEGAIGAVESLREALIGTYDIHMGRQAQRTNDVMKALTMISAVFLPGVVLAGIMGMNFKLEFFDEASNFFVVIGVMVLTAFVLLAVARWRRWI